MSVQYSCETGQTGYWQLSENTRKSNFLQMLLFTKAALYPQLFKEPECWFSWGLNRQPLPQHTSTNPIELIGQLEVMSLYQYFQFPLLLLAALSLPILIFWTFDFVVIIFIYLLLIMHWVCTILYTNKRWMAMAFYTTKYLWKVAPLYPWGTPPFLKKISKINTVWI